MVDTPPPPPGFVLQPSGGSGGAVPPPPPGFVMEGEQAPVANAGRGTRDQREAMDPREMDVAKRMADIYRAGGGGLSDQLAAGIPFSDEAASAIGSFRGLFNGNGMGEEYQRQMEAEQAIRDAYDREHPVLGTAAKVLGGSAIGAPTAGAAAAAKGASVLGEGIIGQSAKGATLGAAGGAVQGASEGQGWDRLKNAESGAKFGAVVGGALPAALALGTGAGRVAKRVFNPVTNPIKNAINPADQAADALGRALSRDNISVDDFATRLDAAKKVNPETVAADLGGANTRGVTRAAINVPGAGREAMMTGLEERSAGQSDRITNAVGAVLKNPNDFAATAARLAAERESKAAPLYQQAFKAKKPVDVTNVVKYIDKEVSPGISGLASPGADLRPDGISATLMKLRSFFATAKNQRVDLQTLHRVKMELDDMIGMAKRSGENTKVRSLMGVKTNLLKSMDKSSKAYRAARSIYSDTLSMEDSMDVGRNVFKMTPDDVRTAVKDMSQSDKEMVQIGVARAIRDRIESISDGRDVIKSVFSTPKIRDTLRAAFGDEGAWMKFQQTLTNEAMMRKTFDAARGNSTTAAQLADLLDMNNGVGRDAISLLLELKPGKALMATVKQIFLNEKGINEKVADHLAQMLLSKDSTSIKRAISVLKQKEVSMAHIRGVIKQVAEIGAVQSGRNAPVQRPETNLAIGMTR